MRFSTIVATIALVASASAWNIPQDSEDGVYKVETLADGSTVHTKIIDAADINRNQPLAPGKSLAPDSPLSKRSDGEVWCGCGYNMVSGDCDAAVADLKTQLQPSTISPNMAYYSIRGKVVAFACNRGDSSWIVFPQNVADSLSAVTSACGSYIAGAQQKGADDQALLVGYQRWNGNDDFCGGARSSPANHC